MFGLPWETTLIMGGSIVFWVGYTLVFYFSTKRWSLEDADYDNPAPAAEKETQA